MAGCPKPATRRQPWPMPAFHRSHRLHRLLLLLLALTLGGSTLTVATRPTHANANAMTTTDPVRELARVAKPLRSTEAGAPGHDLRPLGRMIGSAKIVGLGEATHSSRQFFTTKHRVFRYLVEEQGFTTFALEAPWSTGLVLNEYVLHGKGDPEKLMRKEFQSLVPAMEHPRVSRSAEVDARPQRSPPRPPRAVHGRGQRLRGT